MTDSSSALQEVEAALLRAESTEPRLRAFAHLDADQVRRAAAQEDARGRTGALHGLPVAVKDIIDTADQPTAYGSRSWAGHRPSQDASVVARLRAAGAVPFGKTVTTEFALYAPPVTANPWDSARTPGGSSSGSAAAVAAGVVPAALGTQTAGSVIRPASFCGVVGLKPSLGVIDTTGVHPLSPTFDTVGVFARTVTQAEEVFGQLHSADLPAASTGTTVRVCRTSRWSDVEQASREAFDAAVQRLEREGWTVQQADPGLDDTVRRLADAQQALMAHEVGQVLADELDRHGRDLEPVTVQVLRQGRQVPDAEAQRARATIVAARADAGLLFGDADLILTPAAQGVAPPRETTGDPWWCRAWTALGVPAISLPVLRGAHGLPVGLQLVARPRADLTLLSLARQIEAQLTS